MWWKSKIVLCGYRFYSFIVYIKTDDIYKDISEDVETRFDTSNYESYRPLQQGKMRHTHEQKLTKSDKK